MSPAAPVPPPGAAPLRPAFLRALVGERPERTPVRFAGQTGPAAPAEPADRARLEAALGPELVAARTVRPVEVHGVDAARLASHVALPLHLAGIPLELPPGRGPVIEVPVRTASDVLGLRPIDPAGLAPLRAATALAAAELGAVPLVGVAAAPAALAALLVEGRAGGGRRRARTLMYADPRTWAALLNWCADVAGESLRAQVLAGASAVELVDPAVGAFSRQEYLRRVLPHTQRALSHLRGLDVPIVHAGLGTGEVLDLIARAGVDGIGVDRRIPLDDAAARVGPDATLLGGIDPALLAVPARTLESHVADVLERGRAARAHIVDVGGPLPAGTDPAVLTGIVEQVRDAAG